MKQIENIEVIKIGGENASEIRGNIENIEKNFRKHKKQVLVLSALKADGNVRNFEFNVTENLIKIGEQLSIGSKYSNEKAIKILDEVRDFHIEMIENKLENKSSPIVKYVKQKFLNLKKYVLFHINNTGRKSVPCLENDYSINTPNKAFSLLGFGENLAAGILKETINSYNIDGLEGEVLDTSSLLEPEHVKNLNESQIFDILTGKLAQRVNFILEKGKIPFIPGFINHYPEGILKKVGRGYSDATNSIVGVGLHNLGKSVSIEIQKYVDGFKSSDPRIVKSGTKIISKLDYSTGIESISSKGADAKLLHEQSLRGKVQLAGLPVKIHNPFNDSKGTIIDKGGDKSAKGVQAVLGRKEAFTVSVNSPMSGVGFSEKISSITRELGIDMYEQSGSVTDTTFGIGKDDKEKLENLENKIREELDLYSKEGGRFVNSYKNRSVLFCIGQNINGEAGISGRATMALAMNGIDIKSSSQGESQKSISFTIDNKDYEKGINVLHEELVVKSKLKHMIPSKK